MGLIPGVEGKGVATAITTQGGESGDDCSVINAEMKWPKTTASIAQFILLKFLQQLYAHGHTMVSQPTSTTGLKNCPFQTLPVISNLEEQIEKWKIAKLPGQDCQPTMKIQILPPCQLDPVPIGNTFKLQELEGDCVKNKSHG